MAKRFCKICHRPLARLNPGDICFCHQPGMLIYEHIPTTGCNGYACKGPSQGQDDLAAPHPGSEGYAKRAFERINVGYIDDNGNLVRWDDITGEQSNFMEDL